MTNYKCFKNKNFCNMSAINFDLFISRNTHSSEQIRRDLDKFSDNETKKSNVQISRLFIMYFFFRSSKISFK